MTAGALLAILLLSLIALFHAARLVFGLPVTIDSAPIPMWTSSLGILLPLVIAATLWRDRHQPASPNPTGTFDAEVERIRVQLSQIAPQPAQPDHDWLRALYGHFGERMRSDNERIWSTGEIFVPISLSGFAALLAIDEPAIWKTSILALGSSFLLLLWLFLAESHRSFQRKSEAWLVAILRTIGVQDIGSAKVIEGWQNRLFTSLSVQRMRLALAIIVALGWVTIISLQASGHIL